MNARQVRLPVVVASILMLVFLSPSIASGGERATIEDMVPVLSESQSRADIEHTMSLDQLGEIDPRSTRLIGSDTYARYWVGKSADFDICILIELLDPSYATSASTCATTFEFWTRGLSLAVLEGSGGSDSAAEAYLVPRNIDRAALGFAENDIRTLSLQREVHDANLIAVDPSVSRSLNPVIIPRTSGADFTFFRLERMVEM